MCALRSAARKIRTTYYVLDPEDTCAASTHKGAIRPASDIADAIAEEVDVSTFDAPDPRELYVRLSTATNGGSPDQAQLGTMFREHEACSALSESSIDITQLVHIASSGSVGFGSGLGAAQAVAPRESGITSSGAHIRRK